MAWSRKKKRAGGSGGREGGRGHQGGGSQEVAVLSADREVMDETKRLKVLRDSGEESENAGLFFVWGPDGFDTV